ncbi:hypothetical protein K7432_011824 [Basidiobolus ranarum]|uniref:Conserved oligomeric Golgi complex subunit 1 n=1 Tax=Basidiobolus ranarum TaxID=34480 RepID=A0ABR2VT90_9FUNG
MVELELDKRASLEPVVKELFIKHTIPELRALLKRTKYDIESKRHELRTVVGESYHSLIEAADSIICMRTNGFELSDSIKSLKKHSDLNYLKEQNTNINNPSQLDTEKQKQQLYSTAAQIKLLVDIPEQIWHGLETSKFLSASLLYLIACLVYDSLQKGGDIENINVETVFPVVQKQWNAINYFKIKITRRGIAYIKRADIGEKDVAETLLALLLLDNSLSVEDLFQKLLDMRKDAVKDIFKHPPSNDEDVKNKLLSLLTIIRETIYQVIAIFSDGSNSQEKPLLCSYIQRLTDGYSFHESVAQLPIKEKSTLSGLVKTKPNMHILIRHLPPSLQSYTPSLDPGAFELKFTTLQTMLKKWLDEIIHDSADKIENLLLNSITSVKIAESIRRELWEAISNEEATGLKTSRKWAKICQDIFEEEIAIWDKVFRHAFNKLSHEIVKRDCDTLASQPEFLISNLIETMDSETNIGKFVWESIQFDMHQNEVGLKSMIHQSLCTHTPVVNRVKSAFEFIVNELQEDLSDTISWTSTSEPEETDPFWRKSDAHKLAEHFDTSLLEALVKYREGLSNLLTSLNDNTATSTSSKAASDRSLTIGRIARIVAFSFIEHNQGLHQGYFATEAHRTQLHDEALKLGRDLYTRAYTPWISSVVQNVEETIKGKLILPGWIDSIEQRHCWEVVQASPNSAPIPQTQALVPTHVSSWILEILFDVTKELTRVGNFITDKDMTRTLMLELEQTIFRTITEFLNSNDQVSSSIVLQLLLDMFFLGHFFSNSIDTELKHDSSNNAKTQALTKAESMFDPALSPAVKLALQTNSEQYFEQTGLLLSSLPFTKPTPKTMHSNRRGSISSSGDFQYHHTLPINSPASRFALLPTGQKINKISKPRV